jgi:hypothetical protein
MHPGKKCLKFKELLLRKASGGELNWKEEHFATHHIKECPECQNVERGVELFLQGIAQEKEEDRFFSPPSEGFAEKVLRALRHDRLRRQLQVWKPTLIGAGVTAIAIASVLQVLTTEPTLNTQAQGTAQRPSYSLPQSDTRLFIPEVRTKEKQSPVEG